MKSGKETDRLLSGVDVDRPEIVIGLVGAIGTRLDEVETKLERALTAVGYRTSRLRVSAAITEATARRDDEIPKSLTKMDRLMDQGDFLRDQIKHGGAAAALAITEIAGERNEGLSGGDSRPEREGFATIVRQLKHPKEVQLLRAVYGPRFILIGAWAPEEERQKATQDSLRSRHPGESANFYTENSARLIERDEKDATKPLGQSVRKTFELADAFVALIPGQDAANQITRIVELLFGNPFITPTREEHAMAHAATTSLRSSDAGRQVGAVVADQDGEILVTGVNEVPKPGGGQYWPDDNPDHRDFRSGFDVNERLKLTLITDILAKLQQAPGWLSKEFQKEELSKLAHRAVVDGPLTDSRVTGILEFGRVAHAEMAAICTAARRGIAIGGETMYSTTYPCHECARLIIASGIRRVVYIDPYPKSQVPEMYPYQIVDGSAPTANSSDVVTFEPFRGVAPRLYRSVFMMPDRAREDMTGEYAPFDAAKAAPRLVADAEAIHSIIDVEQGVIDETRKALAEFGFLPATGSDLNSENVVQS
ncbi:anti-phage dCTP deaminase [Antrihabitans stalagmiti]|nr:anti-phage dCTP deaminase [Antrihabitans stalagmiti]